MPVVVKKSLVSVVIPARNEAGLLPKTLNALLVQTANPYEVVIVDNDSSDNTRKAALSFRNLFEKKGIKFRVVVENRVGSAFARNKGFYLVKTPIIASTDADIVPHKDWVENIQKHFQRCDSVAVSGVIVMKDSSRAVRLISELNWYKYLTKILSFVFGFQTITTANAGINKDAFVATSGFDTGRKSPDLLDDTELSSRLCKLGPVRIDTSLRVDGSFRRYQPFTRAITSSLKRLKTWRDISKKYKANL